MFVFGDIDLLLAKVDLLAYVDLLCLFYDDLDWRPLYVSDCLDHLQKVFVSGLPLLHKEFDRLVPVLAVPNQCPAVNTDPVLVGPNDDVAEYLVNDTLSEIILRQRHFHGHQFPQQLIGPGGTYAVKWLRRRPAMNQV